MISCMWKNGRDLTQQTKQIKEQKIKKKQHERERERGHKLKK